MAGKKGTIIEARLSFKPGLLKKLEDMAVQRNLTMNSLIEQLVEVGVVSLQQEPEPIDPWQRLDDGIPTFSVKV
jgi:hypothetical protein